MEAKVEAKVEVKKAPKVEAKVEVKKAPKVEAKKARGGGGMERRCMATPGKLVHRIASQPVVSGVTEKDEDEFGEETAQYLCNADQTQRPRGGARPHARSRRRRRRRPR